MFVTSAIEEKETLRAVKSAECTGLRFKCPLLAHTDKWLRLFVAEELPRENHPEGEESDKGSGGGDG